jgi:hypothetical protein
MNQLTMKAGQKDTHQGVVSVTSTKIEIDGINCIVPIIDFTYQHKQFSQSALVYFLLFRLFVQKMLNSCSIICVNAAHAGV